MNVTCNNHIYVCEVVTCRIPVAPYKRAWPRNYSIWSVERGIPRYRRE